MNEFFRRLAHYYHRRRFEEDLDEEIRHHAELAGRKQFGNITRWKEESRAMWGWTFIEQLIQDMRYAVRAMRNNRAFTALAALSLALGIGANTAIFSFMDAILLRSLPVKDPESLVMLKWRAKRPAFSGMSIHNSSYGEPGEDYTGGVFSYPAFDLFHKNDSVFSSVFAYQSTPGRTVTIHGAASIADGEWVSGDYFRGLGVPPAEGRLIAPDDDRAGAPAVAVVTFSFAQRRFGSPMNAPGQPILIDNLPFTVIGVAPPEFFGTDPAMTPDIFVPLHTSVLLIPDSVFTHPAQWYTDPQFSFLDVMARLRPGISIARAQAALAEPFRQLGLAAGRPKEDIPTLAIQPGAGGIEGLRREYSKPLYLLMTLVGLILAIACANIANLLLARAASRKREMAVRLSMGAGRLRVIRQLLTESVLLAALGALPGLAIAVCGIRFLTLLLANGRENFTMHAELNWHVLGLAAGLSLLTGVLFGLAPAIQSTRVDVAPALKETSQTHSRRRLTLSHALIVSQVAIALLILVAAGLFIRTLTNLESISLGFTRENVLTFQLNARQAGHRDPEILSYYENLREQFSAIPGVRSASLSNLLLIGQGTAFVPVTPKGGVAQGSSRILTVGPDFFSTMQIPILRGRSIDSSDRSDSPKVAVVNEMFAKKNFGDRDPVGKHFTMMSCVMCDIEIVGVSANARYGGLTAEIAPGVYIAYNQGAWAPAGQMTYELRTAGNPSGYIKAVQEIVRQADPRVPLSGIKTQSAWIDSTINQQIAFARLGGVFAFLALAIAGVGLYGTMTYNVARRTNEIGIRMALGARQGRVIAMVLREVLTLIAMGLGVGVPVALATSKFVASFLYGMKPNDPLTLGIALGALVAAALVAAYAPARRASRVDPMAALRHE
jgi:macrolide transport system ATP-binding/permease protein